MAFDKVFVNVEELWATWNVRGFIILSLSLQVFLVLFSPLRKRTSNKIISSLIWMAYLSADWVATFLVGHIATTQGDTSADERELLAFWAAFLLVHLGGPGTITALNFEDNSLWKRHLFSLILQVGTICYIYVRVMSNRKLVVPTILIFISGIIKYSERTAALYFASSGKIKDSAPKDSLKLINDNNQPPQRPFDFRTRDQPDDEIVKHAYDLYQVSRGAIVDLIFSVDKKLKIRKSFQRIRSQTALKLISVELNFFYDALYTKASVSCSTLGLLFRCLSLGSVIVASAWTLRLNKDMYSKFDVKLSYTLLFGATALDVIGLLKDFFSEWPSPIIAICRKASTVGSKFTIKKQPNWVTHKTRYGSTRHSVAKTPVVFRRWSESVSQFSLISYCLGLPSEEIYTSTCESCSLFCVNIKKLSFVMMLIGLLLRSSLQSVAKTILGEELSSSFIKGIDFVIFPLKLGMIFVIDKLGLEELFVGLKYVSKEPMSKELWSFIFGELVQKSSPAATDPQAAENNRIEAREVSAYLDTFLKKGYKYDDIVILCHVTTDLLYHLEICENEDNLIEDTIFAKILSDYMLYLFVKKPTMIHTVAGIRQLQYDKICNDATAAAKAIISNNGLHGQLSLVLQQLRGRHSALTIRSEVCKEILKKWPLRVPTLWSSTDSLANSGRDTEDEEQRKRKWRKIAKVWVELLSYTASRCKGEVHAQELTNGGELITFVWLLMVHLGLTQQVDFGNFLGLSEGQGNK